MEKSLEVLNFYRNLHYKDAVGTETRELAEAINTILPEFVRLREAGNKCVVETPHGTLCACPSGGEEEYPGIRVDVMGNNGKPNVALALVEFIPRDSESFSGYDPKNPEHMYEERAEVPEQRICGDVITEGFVTRAWPNDGADPDDHKRVFHYGYQKEEPV